MNNAFFFFSFSLFSGVLLVRGKDVMDRWGWVRRVRIRGRGQEGEGMRVI